MAVRVTPVEAPLASTGAGRFALVEAVVICVQLMVFAPPSLSAPGVEAPSVTLPPLLSTVAVTAPPVRSPPVPATGVLLPTTAAVGAKLTRSMVAPVAPTRRDTNFGIVIWKSTRALVFNAPAPVAEVDSAFTPSGAARTAISAAGPNL